MTELNSVLTKKESARANQKKYQLKNRDLLNLKAAEYRKNNKETVLNTKYKNRYGITVKEYNTMLAKQGGVCAICKEKESSISRWHSKTIRLAVDHNHTTGVVRGVLCNRCNRGIGYLNDDITILRAAIEYLERK
jgi:hypothetical protein